MIRTRSIIRQFFFTALLLSLAIALVIHFPALLTLIFGEGADRYHDEANTSLYHFITELVITFTVAFLMFTMNFYILKPLDKRDRFGKINILLSVVLTLTSVYILNHLFFGISSRFETVQQGHGHRNEFFMTNFFVSALVIGCVIVFKVIFQKQSMTVEYERLKSEALQSQYESLKNQLSPHFLFNSLTALKILIDESPGKAQEYVNSLSKALRYTLRSNEKQLVTLKEEMEFMESYLFLIRIRFDSNLTINTRIDEPHYSLKLPPLTIQTLVENAIKHNEISKRKPLAIDIYTPDGEKLRVENIIQKKLTDEEGTGIGLTNLSKQFRLLAGKEITISNDQDRFYVDIPLIK
ncbi:MAG TPA: histidine kinase [Bacteroidales bacterium]|nr:histidine kinase [Bacteroidales bacterium]